MDNNNKNYEIPVTAEGNEESVCNDCSSSNDSADIEQNNIEENYLEMLKRLKAEFENFKKRVEKENMELSTLIKSQLIYNLLPVVDDLERMFNNTHPDSENVLAGSKVIYDKLISILSDEGLQPLESVGKDFDPEFHEAVLIESGDDDLDNKIIDEWQKGYLFKSKLLRPAKVKVYKTRE